MVTLFAITKEEKKIPHYWSINILIGFIALIPVVIAFIVTLRQFLKEKYQHALFLTLAHAVVVTWILCQLFSLILRSEFLFLLVFLLFIPLAFLIILLIDSLTRDSVDFKKFGTWTALSTSLFIISLDPDSLYMNSFPELDWLPMWSTSIYFLIIFFCLFQLTCGSYFYYSLLIHRNAPKNFKFFSYLNLIAGFLFVVVVPISLFLINIIGISTLNLIPTGIAFLLVAIAFASQPKLAFILPFKALRLAVIETNSGISLFTHVWSKMDDLIDDQLFSGMLQGISQILNEALKKGEIRDINLEKATLMIKRSDKYSVACVLVATKSSRTLRHALNSFAERFFTKYSPYFSKPYNMDNFNSASELVEERFSFIPEYD